jgi:hypothetical protein
MNEQPGDWARAVAATYRHIAEHSVEPRASANRLEAAKYEAIAARMDRTLARP